MSGNRIRCICHHVLGRDLARDGPALQIHCRFRHTQAWRLRGLSPTVSRQIQLDHEASRTSLNIKHGALMSAVNSTERVKQPAPKLKNGKALAENQEDAHDQDEGTGNGPLPNNQATLESKAAKSNRGLTLRPVTVRKFYALPKLNPHRLLEDTCKGPGPVRIRQMYVEPKVKPHKVLSQTSRLSSRLYSEKEIEALEAGDGPEPRYTVAGMSGAVRAQVLKIRKDSHSMESKAGRFAYQLEAFAFMMVKLEKYPDRPEFVETRALREKMLTVLKTLRDVMTAVEAVTNTARGNFNQQIGQNSELLKRLAVLVSERGKAVGEQAGPENELLQKFLSSTKEWEEESDPFRTERDRRKQDLAWQHKQEHINSVAKEDAENRPTIWKPIPVKAKVRPSQVIADPESRNQRIQNIFNLLGTELENIFSPREPSEWPLEDEVKMSKSFAKHAQFAQLGLESLESLAGEAGEQANSELGGIFAQREPSEWPLEDKVKVFESIGKESLLAQMDYENAARQSGEQQD